MYEEEQHTIEEIAKYFEVNPHTVNRCLHRNGIKMLSPGNRNDSCYAQQWLEPFDLRGKFADKGYDSDRFVHWLEERGAIVVIPSRKTARHPRDID